MRNGRRDSSTRSPLWKKSFAAFVALLREFMAAQDHGHGKDHANHDLSHDRVIEGKLDLLFKALEHLHSLEHRIMATVQEALDAVTATKGKVDSLEQLVKQLHDIIVAMPAGGLTPEQQAAVDQIKALSDTESTEVQAAIDANQPPTP